MLFFYIASLYIVYRYMHCFFETTRDNRTRELVSYGLYFAAGYLVDRVVDLPVINVTAGILFLYLLAQIYPGKQGKKLLSTFLIFGMNMFCEVATVFMLYDHKPDGEYGSEAFYIIVLFMFLCERLIEKFGIRNIKEHTSLKHWDLLIFLPLISIIIVFVLVTSKIDNRYVGVTISVGIILINLIVFYICDEMVGAYIRLEESALVERQLESYSNQLDVLMKSEEKVRGLRHDLKHHLNEILMMAERNKTSDIKDYIKNMQMYMANENEYVSSGNADIDSLLNLMLNKAKNELRKVKCKVSVPCELDIQAFDWNIILGNLVDNAIRAAKESADRFLNIRISYQRGILLINIKNSYQGELVKADDKYISTKEYDRTDASQLHGLGIKNVKKIVEKYNGSIEIEDEDGVFDVKILMYVAVKE